MNKRLVDLLLGSEPMDMRLLRAFGNLVWFVLGFGAGVAVGMWRDAAIAH